jgi:hypothetical protein
MPTACERSGEEMRRVGGELVSRLGSPSTKGANELLYLIAPQTAACNSMDESHTLDIFIGRWENRMAD